MGILKRGDRSWPLWPVVPIYPYGKRRTLRREIIRDQVWTFDQVQGIFYVVVPIRMTVIKLSAGGLMVFSPVAPTRECIRLVRELEAEHGEVKYVILPTVTGVEHKYFAGPFAQVFKRSQVYVAPNQWSFPLDLPLSWLGFPAQRTHILPDDPSRTPFYDEFDYAIVGPIDLSVKPYTEVAVFHRGTRSLLAVDTILSIPIEPPAVLNQDPFPLLFHARDSATEALIDTPENRRKGWARISLFSFYFQPDCLDVPKTGHVLKEASKSPNKSIKNYFGLYPFSWQANWHRSFEQLRQDGRLIVAPILQTLIFNRDAKGVLDWADRIAQWDFEQVIPCHFSAPVEAGPSEFRRAFNFLERPNPQSWSGFEHDVPMVDLETLGQIDRRLPGNVIPPPRR
ncbi:DUF4336 domain-containing protein [cf. Phormidesmis sp. LEGE 11477]|uniref:DUF4336 domain-containing protein n=1 Tax=cf. Phormidesmis sp. LEGE 11477 TaxID=1828680 RepID=UPI001880B3A4|nr:DUF4336 domain-containing protein [cf. Phormidesmis sp. LEGE 11477]MBE9063488.1 DUF4336 domain-containing protein [cf. Phormidesmis sp. LEGE 11477]